MSNRMQGGVGKASVHDSATKHVSGEALYTDDLAEPEKLVHARILMSPYAHARILSMNAASVLDQPGVVGFVSAIDIPGHNDIAPIFSGEPALAESIVEYVGQPIAVLGAESHEEAARAASKFEIEFEPLEPILSVKDALEKEFYVCKPHVLRQGSARKALKDAVHRLEGELHIGGQDHFYLEGQIAMVLPGEDGGFSVFSSTQHPAEVQALVAEFLGLDFSAVTVEVRRMGGGFGGKETHPALIACCAALLAQKTGRPVKLRLDRDDDMIMTGKRHGFEVFFDVGFDDSGRLQGLEMTLAAQCGNVADLSSSILDRALFHADNCYYLEHCELRGFPCKTHTVSNTAFRGFGGPQGMLAIENVMDSIARFLGKDPLEVRKINLYGKNERNQTPYHQKIEQNLAPEIIEELELSSDYLRRSEEVSEFNKTHTYLKKGIALSPVKFGISFTTAFLNQAGALIHIYKDGSVHLNHGGTEMGQGLFTKVAQVVAEELQIDLSQIKITATSTDKVPNTSATAASSGADLNGKAAQNAAIILRNRLQDFAAEEFSVAREEVKFSDNFVQAGGNSLSFNELVNRAYHARVSLSTTGFYKTPEIFYDREKASGSPFYYFAYGAAVSEVLVDTLTGEYKILRSDLLHEVGRSLNPALDLGQVEGAFIQGVGWLTMEELWWDESGALKTHAPSTYKIPTIRDIPADFRVSLSSEVKNFKNTVFHSKAVGEPPLMLGISVWLALKDAVARAAGPASQPQLPTPATPEAVLMELERLKS
jgi:xanthine dehydrogenase large subunit